MNESARTARVKGKSRYDGKAFFYMALVAFGALFLAMGINLALISTGVIDSDTYKVDATVGDCSDREQCRIQYQRDGATIDATFAQTAPSGLAQGDVVRITVFNGEPNRVYTEDVVPIGFALLVGTIGLTVVTYGSIRLYQHWKRQRLETPTVEPAAEE